MSLQMLPCEVFQKSHQRKEALIGVNILFSREITAATARKTKMPFSGFHKVVNQILLLPGWLIGKFLAISFPGPLAAHVDALTVRSRVGFRER